MRYAGCGIGLGQSNPTYFLTTSTDQKYVMRKQPPGKLIKGAHRVDREVQACAFRFGSCMDISQLQACVCACVSSLGTGYQCTGARWISGAQSVQFVHRHKRAG